MDGDPLGLEHVAVGVQVLLVLRRDVAVDVGTLKHDRAGVGLGCTCRACSLPPFFRSRRSLGTKRYTKLLGCFAFGLQRAGLPARVLDDHDVAVRIGLDALEPALPHDAYQAVHCGRESRRCLPDATTFRAFRTEQQAFRPRDTR